MVKIVPESFGTNESSQQVPRSPVLDVKKKGWTWPTPGTADLQRLERLDVPLRATTSYDGICPSTSSVH
ncbi:hypothetical protein PG984_000962 [Apiospora sp. TS-2023a]